jgi:hypothetical protein
MGRLTRNITKAAIASTMVAGMVIAGTGTALATTTPPAPVKPVTHHNDTKFTFYRDGKKITEWVPDSSIGYVTPDVPSDLQACALDAIGVVIPGADDGTYVLTKNKWYDAWEFVPGSSCIDWFIKTHHHPKPKPKVTGE